MYIYLFLLVILLIVSKTGANNKILLSIFIVLAVVLGFRSDSVGMDTYPYIRYYAYVSDLTDGYMERGWNIMLFFFKMMGFSAYGFNFIVALLTLIPYYIVGISFKDKKISGYILFLLYSLGFYLLMFNGMRQFLAMSLILMGYKFLENKRIVLFIFFVLLATTIHTSSFLAFALLFIFKIRLNTKKTFIALSLTYVTGIFLGETFFLSVTGKYAHDIYDFGFRNSFMYTLVVGLLTNAFTIYIYEKNTSLQNNFWVKCNVVSVIVLNLLSNLVIGPRIVYIFSITSVFALALYLRYSSKQVYLLTYLYSIVTFSRFILPEILAYGREGSLVPYSMTFLLFE